MFRLAARLGCPSVAVLGISSLNVLASLSLAQTYTTWRSAQFTSEELENAAISGPAADPDGDGVPNLHEYVFVGAPKLNETNLNPILEVVADTLALTYRERLGLADSGVRVNLETSDLLTHWVTPNSVVEADREPFATEGYDLVTLLDPVPPASAASSGRRFLRLRIDTLFQSSALKAPTNPALTALSPTAYELRWNDWNFDETEHRIERLLSATGEWEAVAVNEADTSRGIHASANYRESFTYRVMALRSVDNVVAISEPVALPDSDGDGIPDVFELGLGYLGLQGTYPTSPDKFSSGDNGVSDGWSVANGFDPVSHDFSVDTDGDGMSDAEEALRGTDPRVEDTDGDGALDAEDGWPRDPHLSPPLVPEAGYVVVPLTRLGWNPAYRATSLDDVGRVWGVGHLPYPNYDWNDIFQMTPGYWSAADGMHLLEAHAWAASNDYYGSHGGNGVYPNAMLDDV